MQPRILGILECAAASAAQTKLRATKGAQLRLKTYVIRHWGQQLSQVIIISSLRGYLVPAGAIAAGALYHLIKSLREVDLLSVNLLFYSIALLLGALYFFLGQFFDSKKQKNDFFFIPMRYYSGIVAAVLILDFFWPFVER